MSEVTKIYPEYSRRVQLEQYEPMQHGVEMEVTLSDDDDPEEVYNEYSELAEALVEHAIAERIAAKRLDKDSDDD